jgi:hypothetical protein
MQPTNVSTETMESKFKLRQSVWLMLGNRPYETKINRIRKTKSFCAEYPPTAFGSPEKYPDPIMHEVIDTEYEIFRGERYEFVSDAILFPTKEELVKSLLE